MGLQREQRLRCLRVQSQVKRRACRYEWFRHPEESLRLSSTRRMPVITIEKSPLHSLSANRCCRRREDWSESLLDCHRFGQISWLIYVAASAHGDVIGEQLQRDDLQNCG